MRTNYYSSDPKWISAKFDSTCACCKKPVKRGNQVFYNPSAKSVSCDAEDCGKQESRDFDAAKFDECQYGGDF
jgi:hypothetical protein